jgi:heptaprenyl diphosphate synthase
MKTPLGGTDETRDSSEKPDVLIPFLAAACFFLSAVEYAIPKPIPILRVGLANLPVMLSLPKLKFREYAFLVLLKVAAQAFVSGTVFSYVFAFSAAGSFASALTMRGVYLLFAEKKPLAGYVGISAAGSLANNAAQLALARFFLFGEGTRFIAPLLLVSGCATGTALGMFAEAFAARSKWLALVPDRPRKPARGKGAR